MEVTKHPKQDFQVERLAFFSDAIFAIALTLLIIDFKVPAITKDSTYDTVLQQLYDLWPSLLALILSFFMVSSYWMRHHFLFKHIHNYNRPIVIMNMLLLLPIIFIPFTSSFLAQIGSNTGPVILAFRIYALNQIVVMLALLAFYVLVFVVYKEHTYEINAKEKIKFLSNNISSIIVFSCVIISTFFNLKGITIYIIITVLGKRMVERYLLKRSERKNTGTPTAPDLR